MRARLVELRQKHNLTQSEVANYLGIARTTYAGYEQDVRKMDYDLRLKLREKYNVTLDYMFGLSELPIQQEEYSNDEIIYIKRQIEFYRELKSKFLKEGR